MDEIKNDYIEEALKELVSTLGVREFVDHKELISLINSKKIKEAIKAISLYFGLPVEVEISYVPKGYRPDAKDTFQSTHIVKTDGVGRGSGGITAQVFIPTNLPFYGSPDMTNFPIRIKLSEDCAENPKALISVMAHELSHIFLHSMKHKERENEFYTDLTAMVLGFAEIMDMGRKVVKTTTSTDRGFLSSTTTSYTETMTYGYLSDDNFSFALNRINSILDEQKAAKKKLLKKLRLFEKYLNKTKKLSLHFNTYLKYLDKNLNKKISQEDGRKISTFHESGYLDQFQTSVKKNEQTLKNFLEFVEKLKIYTKESSEAIPKYEAELKLANQELAKQHFMLNRDIDIMKKYVGLFHKIKFKLK